MVVYGRRSLPDTEDRGVFKRLRFWDRSWDSSWGRGVLVYGFDELDDFGGVDCEFGDVFAVCWAGYCGLLDTVACEEGREKDSLPFRRVKLLPGSILSTIPLNCAPGGELSVTSMVSPMNWFDIFLRRVLLHRC
jgi:hypothetical protein